MAALVSKWRMLGTELTLYVSKIIVSNTLNCCHIHLVAVHRHKRRIVLDKPIINGMIILDLSKYLIYDVYYNFLQNVMVKRSNYYSQIQIVYVWKLKQRIST